jgi:hypothetical protein
MTASGDQGSGGSRRATLAAAWALAAAAIGCPSLEAGGPLLVGPNGVPRRWSTASPVTLNPDRGTLGGLSAPLGLLREAAGEWNKVSTSRLRLEVGSQLSSNVENLSASQFDSFITKDDGTNPVIFDADGSMFDDIFGFGSGVIGVAGPTLFFASSGTIVKGFAMFNGDGVTSADGEIMVATMTHELGHIVNLDHTQVNGLPFLPDCGNETLTFPGFAGAVAVGDVETMFPVLVRSGVSPHPMATLHRDDIAAVSSIYATASFTSNRGSISGTVVDFDGTTPIQGLNVVARNVADPFADAVSCVSGFLYDPDGSSLPRSQRGAFEMNGLTPGASYKVYIEEVAACFGRGGQLGPVNPPLDLDPTDPAAFFEFWSGPRESDSDAPLDAEAIVTAAGKETSGVRIVFNGILPRVESVEPETASYAAPVEILIAGANLTPALAVELRGPETVRLSNIEAPSSSVLGATVPASIAPGEYVVVVVTPKGSSSALEGPIYTVTEALPAITRLSPDQITNDSARLVTVTGTNLLGARTAKLLLDGAPAGEIEILRIDSLISIVVEIPAGLPPGTYEIVVANTIGQSIPSADTIRIVELEPVLFVETVPESASGGMRVRVQGENLAGTTKVELVFGSEAVSCVIVSASLNEVIIRVPKGLEPRRYVVRLTNTEGTATGPALLEVRAGSGGGGGGCSGVVPAGSPGQPDFPILLALLAAIIIVLRARRGPGPSRSEPLLPRPAGAPAA